MCIRDSRPLVARLVPELLGESGSRVVLRLEGTQLRRRTDLTHPPPAAPDEPLLPTGVTAHLTTTKQNQATSSTN